MNVEPESKSKTNEYLKGIVANLPEKPGIYQSKEKSLFLFQQRA